MMPARFRELDASMMVIKLPAKGKRISSVSKVVSISVFLSA